MENINMTVKEAAKYMGKTETFVREGLARGLLPFGTGYKLNGNENRTFFISRAKFFEYVGIEDPESSKDIEVDK